MGVGVWNRIGTYTNCNRRVIWSWWKISQSGSNHDVGEIRNFYKDRL